MKFEALVYKLMTRELDACDKIKKPLIPEKNL